MLKIQKKVLITIPVFNEEKVLKSSIVKTIQYCRKKLQDDWEILIADNASTDKTAYIGKKLAENYKRVSYFSINERGRGKVLHRAWDRFLADCYVYMDVDLSTSLKHLSKLVNKVLKEDFDIAVGTRNHKDSKVKRSFVRTVVSKVYIFLVKIIFNTNLSDTQCGFKAFNKAVVKDLWRRLEPRNWQGSAWFFDTEILILSEKRGYLVFELPVKWIENKGTKVRLLRDFLEFAQGLIRLKQKID